MPILSNGPIPKSWPPASPYVSKAPLKLPASSNPPIHGEDAKMVDGPDPPENGTINPPVFPVLNLFPLGKKDARI